MPGLSGQQLHLELVAKNSPLAVIYLTGHGDVPMAVDALKLGAVDFFQKPADSLCIAMRTVEIHRANLMKGMQVGSLAEMMLIYSRIAERLRLE